MVVKLVIVKQIYRVTLFDFLNNFIFFFERLTMFQQKTFYFLLKNFILTVYISNKVGKSTPTPQPLQPQSIEGKMEKPIQKKQSVNKMLDFWDKNAKMEGKKENKVVHWERKKHWKRKWKNP